MCRAYSEEVRQERLKRLINYYGRRANGMEPVQSIPEPEEVRLERLRLLAQSSMRLAGDGKSNA